MSEALDRTEFSGRDVAPRLRLRFTPGEELNGYLRRFARQDYFESLGRSGLFLYSDRAMASDNTSESGLASRRSTMPPELVEVDRHIRAHAGSRLPLAKRFQISPSAKEAPGVKLHMDVIVGELTARAIMGQVRVQPDMSVNAFVKIPKDGLVDRDTYMEASKDLYARLLSDSAKLTIMHTDMVRPIDINGMK